MPKFLGDSFLPWNISWIWKLVSRKGLYIESLELSDFGTWLEGGVSGYLAVKLGSLPLEFGLLFCSEF